MKSLHYYTGTLGLSTTLILGMTLYDNGWKDFKTFLNNLYNGSYTVLYGIMGSALCGLGQQYLTNNN